MRVNRAEVLKWVQPRRTTAIALPPSIDQVLQYAVERQLFRASRRYVWAWSRVQDETRSEAKRED